VIGLEVIGNGVEFSWMFLTCNGGASRKEQWSTSNFFELLQGSTFAQSRNKKKKKKSAFVDNDVRIMNHFSFFFRIFGRNEGNWLSGGQEKLWCFEAGIFLHLIQRQITINPDPTRHGQGPRITLFLWSNSYKFFVFF
jgi:hypothetical protein